MHRCSRLAHHLLQLSVKFVFVMFNISLSNDTSTGFDTCSGIMMDFRVKVNITKTNFTLNCSNWANLKSLIPAIKLCNKGNTTGGDKLKAKEIEIKKELAACKSATGTCKNYEDQTISYIATCKTSSSSLKKVLVALYQSKEKLAKVNTKINQALNTTNSSRRARSTEAKALEDCASLTVSVALFVTYSSSVELDTIGTNETIKTVATSISITSITSTSCTSTEKASLTTAQTSVNTLITKVET